MVFEYKIVSADDDIVKCQIYHPKIKLGYDLEFSRTHSIEDVFRISVQMANNLLIEEKKLSEKFDEVMDNGS